jgi:hypothetical protein
MVNSDADWSDNMQNAWAALRMIRETIETLGPPGNLATADDEDAIQEARQYLANHGSVEARNGSRRIARLTCEDMGTAKPEHT